MGYCCLETVPALRYAETASPESEEEHPTFYLLLLTRVAPEDIPPALNSRLLEVVGRVAL